MSDHSESTNSMGGEGGRKPMWRTPTLTTDSIGDATRHISGSAGIDRYEAFNPVGYGVS